jgi:hypothetical protein
MSAAADPFASPTEDSPLAIQREEVAADFKAASARNWRRFNAGDAKATQEYIFANQKEDAFNITEIFNKKRKVRAVSVQKRTKVGADGLMLALIYFMTTHSDDEFIVSIHNIRILTGMSNISWEEDMKEKAPLCIKDKIFHHGALSRSGLPDLRNALIIVDEVDCGGLEMQKLHDRLREANLLDIAYLEEHNIRLVFISATMIQAINELQYWGELHETYRMTIPSSYIGHGDFLRANILKEFYPLATAAAAEKWIDEDILAHYGEDKRVHIARTRGEKEMATLKAACEKKGVAFRPHTSDDRLTSEEEEVLFKRPLRQHVVLAVKGLFRRANLIPNAWKLRIGATHERYTKKVDVNVQIQGLPGRMTGYWRSDIEGGHTTGPHRTSLAAIRDYEKMFGDPLGPGKYYTRGFEKVEKRGVVKRERLFCSPENVIGLEGAEVACVARKAEDTDREFMVFKTQTLALTFANVLCPSQKTQRRSPPFLAPETLRDADGKNPTLDYVRARFYGIDAGTPKPRMVPLHDDQWCVYWKPSLVAAINAAAGDYSSDDSSDEEDDGKAAGGAGAGASVRL